MGFMKYLFILLVVLTLLTSILLFITTHNENPDSMTPQSITQHAAVQIARQDAEQAYRDLSVYRVDVHEDGDYWYIDYELKDPQMTGGGPHYVISKTDGMIVDKRYEQ
jgi:hypothetical protein